MPGKNDQSDWLSNNEYIWSINVSKTNQKLLMKTRNNSIPLEKVALFSLGITPYDKYKGHSKNQITEKVFHSNYKKDEFYKKLLAGNDVLSHIFYYPRNTRKDTEKESRISNAKKKNRVKSTKILVIY